MGVHLAENSRERMQVEHARGTNNTDIIPLFTTIRDDIGI